MSDLGLQELLVLRGYSLVVIAITGYVDVSTAVRVMKAGALEFLEKPFSDQQLLEGVRSKVLTYTLDNQYLPLVRKTPPFVGFRLTTPYRLGYTSDRIKCPLAAAMRG